jgi:diadenylate cyclase
LNDILRRLQELKQLSLENLINLIDILLVAYVVYRILSLIRSTRAWRILGGIVIFVAALFLSDYLQLKTLHWLLDKATLLAPVALVILLLPELRQTLEGFAKLGLWPERLGGDARAAASTVEEIVAAVAEMAAANVGSLIVIERGSKLEDVAANGVQLNAQVSAPLLGSIFYEGNPLHDGAAIIRQDAVVAAACRLPLSEDIRLDHHLHMRHRAGLGISEQADCVVVIVSEERGTISVAVDGALRKLDSHGELREVLNTEVRGVHQDRPRSRRKRKEKVGV